MKAAVRNQLSGKVVDIKMGTVMAQVTVQAGDALVSSVMTRDSLEETGLKVGDQVTALFKAVNVVIAKE
ncbi:TOBE domain-containing protein [Syntrophomonas palmitatica]|uniref:TOBE domain-containing protein n=1 Tax=Syntrophomonas palmitatica TaxID=402877 RepID=UPI0006D0EF39|nr:TOBE domain-containing protein [Syntrophomonas palmitatica]